MNYNRTIKGDTKDNTEGNDVCYKKFQKKELQTITKYNILSRYVAKKRKETITKLRII